MTLLRNIFALGAPLPYTRLGESRHLLAVVQNPMQYASRLTHGSIVLAHEDDAVWPVMDSKGGHGALGIARRSAVTVGGYSMLRVHELLGGPRI